MPTAVRSLAFDLGGKAGYIRVTFAVSYCYVVLVVLVIVGKKVKLLNLSLPISMLFLHAFSFTRFFMGFLKTSFCFYGSGMFSRTMSEPSRSTLRV